MKIYGTKPAQPVRRDQTDPRSSGAPTATQTARKTLLTDRRSTR